MLLATITIAVIPSSQLVTSFHTGTTSISHHSHHLRQQRSSSSPTKLFVASSSARATSPATLNYLNSLQSITSNPQLFPVTSDTIEALLSSQQQQSNVDGSNGEITPKEFLKSLSREVRLASSSTLNNGESIMEEQLLNDGVTTSSSTLNGGIVNNAASLTNAANDNVAAFTPSVKTAIASSNNSESKSSSSSSSSNSSRGVSGLRQAASKRINTPLSSSTSSSTIQEDEVLSWDTAYTTTTNNNNEVQSSTKQEETSNLFGVPITNPNTPLLSTTIGLTTGLTTHELIDEYAYQFQSWHNTQLSNLQTVQQQNGQQWDDLIGRYIDPLNEVEGVVEDVVRGVEYLGREVVGGLESVVVASGVGGSVVGEVSIEGVSVTNGVVNGYDGSVENNPLEASESVGTVPPPLEATSGAEDAPLTSTLSETATSPIQSVDSDTSSAATTTAATPSVDKFAVEKDVTTPSSSIDNGNENLLSDVTQANTPVEGTTQYETTTSSTDSIPESPSLLDGNVGQIDNSLSDVTPSSVSVESTQSLDVWADVSTSLVREVTVDGASISPPTASNDGSDVNLVADATITPTDHAEYSDIASPEVSNVDQGVLSSPSESADTKLFADTTSSTPVEDVPKQLEAAASPSVEDTPTIQEHSQETLLADASTSSSSVDLSQHSEVPTPPSLNEAVINQDVTSIHESSQATLLADTSKSAPVDLSQHSEALSAPSLNDVASYDLLSSVHDNDHANLLASKTDSVDLSQNSEMISPPTINEAIPDVASVSDNTNPTLMADASGSTHVDHPQSVETLSSPPSISKTNSLEGGSTDLLADASQSTSDVATMYPDVSGTDVLPHSSTDVARIDQNVMHTPAPTYESGNFDDVAAAESTHQQRWFTAPSSSEQHITSDGYTHTDYSATVDQSSYSSSVGFDSDSIATAQESFSSWHSQGSSNPLRDLAASLPPPVDRARGTGGDYYGGGDVTSQWVQADELLSADVSNVPMSYHEEVMAQAADATNSFATQTTDEFAEQIFSGADQVESLDSVTTTLDAVSQSQPLDSLHEVTSSSSSPANDAVLSAKAKLFGSVSNSLGDIQGEANIGNGLHTPFDTQSLDESTFTSIMHNAGESFQSIHPPAAVSSVIQHASDASLADIGHGIMEAVKFMAGILLTVVDANLDLAAPGSSSSSVLQSIQTSVNTMLDNASYTVANVINDVGNLSLKDIVHNLMVLMVATADILMKVMNAVVYLLSGKDAGSWALQATSTVNEASTQLLAQADDVTHRSIGDLASSIGDYSYHVGNELVALLGSLNGAEGGHLDSSTLDVITTALQTGFTM